MADIYKKTALFFKNMVLLSLSLLSLFPLIWMLYSSFKSKKEFTLNIVNLPQKMFFKNYTDAFNVMNFETYFFNSLIVTLTSVLSIIVVGFLMGYGLSRFNFKAKKGVLFIVLIGFLIPIHSLLIPVFIEFRIIGLYNKLLGVIVVNIAVNLSISVFLISGYITSIPYSLEESTLLEGAKLPQTMFKIVFPLCKPVLSTVAILAFLGAWNEFPFTLVLISSQALKTIPLGVANFFGEYSTNYTTLMAGSVISMLPVIIIYTLFSKSIQNALTEGAVKE